MSFCLKTLLSHTTTIGISVGINLALNIYYFAKYNNNNNNSKPDDLLTQKDQSTSFASLILQIRNLSRNYFQTKEPNLVIQRRNSLDTPDEYLKLCKQTITLNDESNAYAIETILKSFPNSTSIESFYDQLQSIPPKQLQREFLKSFRPTESESTIGVSTLKEAKLYLYTITIDCHKELLSQLESFHSSNEIEHNRRKGFLLMVNHIKVNDMLYNKYGVEEDRLEMLCLQKGLSGATDKDLQQKEEELKQLTNTTNNSRSSLLCGNSYK